MMQWVLGDSWGWRSLDGQSAAESEANRRNGARFILELNGGMAVLAVLAVALIPLSGASTDGINVPLLLVCVGFGAFVIAPVVWFLPKIPAYWVQLLGLAYEAALTVAAFAIGPKLSSTVVAFYVVEGVCVVTLATRRAAIVHLVAMGVGYGLLVSLQPGNAAPLTRWLIGMGAVVIAGSAVALLTQRMRTQLGRLRPFVSTPVANILSTGAEKYMRPHRAEIAVFFCDLRSFTAFAASSRPEEVHHVLDEYFEVLGGAIRRHNATVGAFTGDGLMAFFNDPLPCDDPALAAIAMASELQEAMEVLLQRWRPRGYELGLGVGIALGEADLGLIGFEGRRDYSAIGTVVNLASRLCDEAAAGEILIDESAYAATEQSLRVDGSALISLKGLREPVLAYSARLLNDPVV